MNLEINKRYLLKPSGIEELKDLITLQITNKAIRFYDASTGSFIWLSRATLSSYYTVIDELGEVDIDSLLNGDNK